MAARFIDISDPSGFVPDEEIKAIDVQDPSGFVAEGFVPDPYEGEYDDPFGMYPTELHPLVTDVAQTAAAATTLVPGFVAGGFAGMAGGVTEELGTEGQRGKWAKEFDPNKAVEWAERARESVSVPFPTEGPIGKVVSALFEMISGQQLFTKAGRAVEYLHKDFMGEKMSPEVPTEGLWESQTHGPGEYEVYGDIAAPSLDEAKMVARSPIVSTAIATLGEFASFTLFGKAIHATRAKNSSPSAADYIEAIEGEYKALPPSRIIAKRPPDGPPPVHVPGPHGPRALPPPAANWRGVQGGIEPEVVPQGPLGLPERPPRALTGETPAVHRGGAPAAPPEGAVPQAGAPGFVAYDSQRAVVGPRKPYELPVTKEPPALPEKGTETSIAPSPKEGVGVSGAIVQFPGQGKVIAYHGGPAGIREFKQLAPERGGYWFSPDRELARPFSEENANPNVYRTEITFRNPKEVTPRESNYLTPEKMKKYMSEGFDGLISRNKDGSVHEYVVFDPRQARIVGEEAPVTELPKPPAEGDLRQGGPLEGADLLEMDYFYREKTYELNKQIKGHIPDAPPEAIRYVGTNKPTKTRPALPLFQDNHFTGSSFTLQKNPKGHVNEGLWETPYEALVRKRAQFENYPVRPPHELTYEQFSKGPSITDPTSPIRKHALPALKIGDEYAVGYNATTHLGVYEELMNEGSWPVDVPLEKAESAWVVNGKGIVADPGATMKHIHRSLVEDAYSEGKVIPKAVKEQYPDIFEREAIDRAKAVDDQMVDLANDMETWEGTRNIYDDKGQFVRRAKATYPSWFKKVFKQDSKGFVADTINRYQFAKSKGVKNPFPNQPRRNRVIDTLKEVIKDSVESGKHIVEKGYAARLLKSEEGFFSVAGIKEKLDPAWKDKFNKSLNERSQKHLDDEYNSYWIASDGRSVPLGSRPGYKKEHHFEYAERIIHGTKDQIGNFVTPSEFGQKTGAIRAHISPSAMILEAFGPVSRKQAELIRKYATEHKTDIKWEVVSPFKTSFGEGVGAKGAREFSWDTYSQYGIDLNAPNLLRDERGFLNIVPSKSKGPFTFENIQRARELARKQGGTKFEKAVLGWSEFWKPWSTLPDSQLQLAVRYKFMGDLGRSGKFIDKQFEILKKYPQATRKDLFHFMDGQLPADALPPELLGVATRLRKISNWVGQMAVKRGLINKDTFLEMKDSYIHYMYLKHFFPEGEAPVGGQRMDRGTFKRRKGLTYEQQQAIELMEDVAVAFPTGIGKTLADVFRYDYFKTLAENPQITWQPARVAVDEIPVMRKGEPTGKTKPELKSIGEIDKEIKMYERMAAMKEGGLNPVAQERYNKLKVAEAQAKEISGNAPEGFRQMPISENYGPLSGAFVRKPVYNDIMPLVRGLMSDPESGWAQAIKGFETATTVFKVAKVPLNPPTVIRNIVSNLLQMNMSGIPFWDVPFVWERGIRSFIAKDKFYRQLERMGGYHTNFTVAELGEIHEVFRDIISKGKKGYWPIRAAGKLAKYYGRIDDIAKLSLYRHAVTKKGMSPGLAAVHAQKWGMDYSMTSRSVKGARRTVLPFVTYQYKIAPLIVEAMLKRPWVIAKFAIAPYVLTRIAAKKFNWTKDDVEEVQKELAERTRHKGNYVILPFKDNRGDVEFMNLEYYFPWGNWQDFLGDVTEGKLEAKEAIGFGGWWANYVHFMSQKLKGKPPIDPFSGLAIYSQFDSPATKVLKFSEWSANLFLPSTLTRHGVAGHAYKAATGQKDQWGREVTPAQAIARFFGANIGTLNRRQLKIMRKAKMKALWADFYRQVHDPRTDASERAELKRKMRDKLRGIQRGEE